MTRETGSLLLILLLIVTSLSFFYSAWFIWHHVSGNRKLFKRILGDDLEDFNVVKKNRNALRIDLMRLMPKSYVYSLSERLSKAGELGDEFLKKTVRNKFVFSLAGFVGGAFYFLPSGSTVKMSLAGIFGFLIPDILLTNKIQKRAELIQGALPDAVEMLTMCVESGLSFQQSLQRVSESQKNVISTEFARVMSEIQIGTPRVLALENMGERLNHPDVSKFVNSMLQVDRLGIPISSVLGEQISDLRTRARMRAREKAMKVPVKILGPVMVCFMPCTLIIVLGPVILSFVS